jgi:hypothetical protein
VNVQGFKKYSTSFNATLNSIQYQYTCITSNTISDESELCCGCETRFGQVISCGIHHSSGGGNLALFHCTGTKKEWEAPNLHGFLKIECYHKNDPYLLTFMEEVLDMVVGHEVYSFLGGFSNYHHIIITLEDMYYLHYKLGNVCLDSHAFWIEKCSTDLLASNEYVIS